MPEPILDDQLRRGQLLLIADFTLQEVRDAQANNSGLSVPMVNLIPRRESVSFLRLSRIQDIVELEGGFGFVGYAEQLVVDVKHVHEIEATVVMECRTVRCEITVTGRVGDMKCTTRSSISELTGIFPQDLPVF